MKHATIGEIFESAKISEKSPFRTGEVFRKASRNWYLFIKDLVVESAWSWIHLS